MITFIVGGIAVVLSFMITVLITYGGNKSITAQKAIKLSQQNIPKLKKQRQKCIEKTVRKAIKIIDKDINYAIKNTKETQIRVHKICIINPNNFSIEEEQDICDYIVNYYILLGYDAKLESVYFTHNDNTKTKMINHDKIIISWKVGN